MLTTLFILLSTLVTSSVQVANYDCRDCIGSGIQNWGLALSDESLVCANSRGLLYFNGNDWSLQGADDGLILRDVLICGERYYVVGEGCIGFWSKDETGRFFFTSYSSDLEGLGLSSEDFWFVEKGADGILYFHSFSCILMLAGDTVSEVVRNECYDSFFKVGDHLMAKNLSGELFELNGGKLNPVCGDKSLIGVNIRGSVESRDGVSALFASDGTVYSLNGKYIRRICQLTDMSGDVVKVDCVAESSKGVTAVGTLGDGVLIIDEDFNTYCQILSPDLADNNIHSIQWQEDGKLWVTMDYGLGRVDFNPRVRMWQEKSAIGFFFDAVRFGNEIYVSTSSGLYSYETGEKAQKDIYPLGMSVVKDRLLCGTTDGILQMNAGMSDFIRISDYKGAHQFEYKAEDGVEWVFASVWAGVVALKYDESRGWVYHSFLTGTTDYTTIFVEDVQTLWAVKPGVGLVKLDLSRDVKYVERETVYGDVAGVENLNRLFFLRMGGTPVVVAQTGIFRYDSFSDTFKMLEVNGALCEYLNSFEQILQKSRTTFYAATKHEILHFEMASDGILLKDKYYLGDTSPVFYNNSIYLSQADSLLFLSTYDGILTVDMSYGKNDVATCAPALRLESVRYINSHGDVVYVGEDNGVYVIPNKSSDIVVSFASGISDPYGAVSWRMDDIYKEWHSWQGTGTVSFTDLKSGVYRLQAKNYQGKEQEVVLKVRRPIALSPWMVAVYIVLLSSLTALSVIVVNRRQKKTEIEHLKAVAYKELQEKTEMLRSQHKTQMRLIMSQSKFIETISAEVDNLKVVLGPALPDKIYRKMISAIDDSRAETGNLYSLENYYVDIHYEFMQRLQRDHPSLSPSELKFCCLLRANLSTKEIAQILGISSRSVDLKKYRLKIHMELSKDMSLLHYILNY